MTFSQPTVPTPPRNLPTHGIRPVEAADREAVLGVLDAVGLFPGDELAEVEKLLDAFLSGVAGAGDRWITFDAGGGPVGVAYYAPERMTDGTWNLYLLAVSPAGQGAGRGAALVARVEADLRAEEARVLLIETSGVEDFAAQRRFYRRLGYREEARIHDFYAEGDDKVIFWKTLVALR